LAGQNKHAAFNLTSSFGRNTYVSANRKARLAGALKIVLKASIVLKVSSVLVNIEVAVK
jgi:hypothetical protein